MKIAYIVLAHKLPKQLVRLVKKLNTESTSFLVHIDKKTDRETYQRMVKPLRDYDNVHLLKRHVCNWGAFGHLQATLEGIREALALRPQFDYLILLSGQDYPIKSNEYIQKFFDAGNRQSYIEYFPLPSEIWKNENGGMDRINFWHLYFLGRPHKVFPRFYQTQRKLLRDYDVFGGSSYWCLARDCVEYVNDHLERDSSFVKFWKYAAIPDEMFFQTILVNSHLRSRLINNNLRYIVWSNSPHPVLLSTKDYEQLIHSDKLFARKFDATVDAEILDLIDQVIS